MLFKIYANYTLSDLVIATIKHQMREKKISISKQF